MAKPIRALELHYPMIQFLVIFISHQSPIYYHTSQLARKHFLHLLFLCPNMIQIKVKYNCQQLDYYSDKKEQYFL